VLTIQEVTGWIGRIAQDPYGEPVGRIVGAMHDRETGMPEWLVVASDGGSETEGSLVPAGGAAVTGKRIRIVATADAVAQAPRLTLGDELDLEGKRAVAAHYGLVLDTGASGTGQLRRPDARDPGTAAEPAAPAPWSAASPQQRAEIVDGLRAAHAMEQASLKLLAAMRWRAEDEELVHDLTFHHKETNDHAERLRARLDELDERRGRPFDWVAKLVAYAQAQRGRLRAQPDPQDLRAAHAFEQTEIGAYDRLERLAREAGDARTAALCVANRADEVAMQMTIERSRLWADPGARRDEPSPFAAPEELAQISPQA
jgi:ferritin-like metal-binding protein YciE